MAILKVNNVGDPLGTTDPITLSSPSTTTATWASSPANMPTVASPDILKVVAEPNTSNEEIMYVTAYTASATSATVNRGQEGSTARTHAGTAWVHTSTAADFSPMTLVGDLEVGGANGALTRLPIGAAGTVLSALGGTPAWAGPGILSVYLSADQPVAANAYVTVVYNGVYLNTFGGGSYNPGNGVFVCPVAGMYLITAQAGCLTAAISMQIVQGAAGQVAFGPGGAYNYAWLQYVTLATTIRSCAAGDSIYACTYGNTTNTLKGVQYLTYMTIELVK